MLNVIGAEELVAKGVTSIKQLRPVLTAQMAAQQAAGMAVNATLRLDEWRQIDARVTEVMRERLTIADDLRALGLVTNVSIGTILRVTERIADFDAAEVNFDGDTPPEEDRPSFSKNVIPVPVISKGFRINWRQLDASRGLGEPLDVTAAGIATRKVRDQLQNLITNGLGRGPGYNPASGTDGQSIPGLLTAANRLKVSLGTAWDAASGADIIGDVERALETAYSNYLFGPFYLYVPKTYWAAIQKDYQIVGGMSTQTYMARILSFADIKAVRPLDTLPDDNVVLVQMTEDVMDLTEAQTVTTIQWEKSPLVTNFRVLMIGGPHIKDIETQDGNTICGIVHIS